MPGQDQVPWLFLPYLLPIQQLSSFKICCKDGGNWEKWDWEILKSISKFPNPKFINAQVLSMFSRFPRFLYSALYPVQKALLHILLLHWVDVQHHAER